MGLAYPPPAATSATSASFASSACSSWSFSSSSSSSSTLTSLLPFLLVLFLFFSSSSRRRRAPGHELAGIRPPPPLPLPPPLPPPRCPFLFLRRCRLLHHFLLRHASTSSSSTLLSLPSPLPCFFFLLSMPSVPSMGQQAHGRPETRALRADWNADAKPLQSFMSTTMTLSSSTPNNTINSTPSRSSESAITPAPQRHH